MPPFTQPSPGIQCDGDSGLYADLEHVHGMPASWPSAAGPAIVVLTDGATITPNTSLGDVFRVTIAGNRTIAAPSNTPVDGQKIRMEITQDATGSRTLTWNAIYDWGTAGAPTLTTTAGKTDLIEFAYNATAAKLYAYKVALGF